MRSAIVSVFRSKHIDCRSRRVAKNLRGWVRVGRRDAETSEDQHPTRDHPRSKRLKIPSRNFRNLLFAQSWGSVLRTERLLIANAIKLVPRSDKKLAVGDRN